MVTQKRLQSFSAAIMVLLASDTANAQFTPSDNPLEFAVIGPEGECDRLDSQASISRLLNY